MDCRASRDTPNNAFERSAMHHRRRAAAGTARPLNASVRPMRRVSTMIAALCLANLACAADADGAFASIVKRLSGSTPCPLSVSAVAKDTATGPVLEFSLKNTTANPLTFLKPFLPWTKADSIEVAALTEQGEFVRGAFPIDDYFGTERISLAPQQVLTGSYDLKGRWAPSSIPPTGLPPKSRITIVWAWRVQADGLASSAKPVCSGVSAFTTFPVHGPNKSLQRTRER